MAVLGVGELLKRVREQKLVEGLCERELTNPEGAGFDIRLAEVYKLKGDAFLGVDERRTPEVETVAKLGEHPHYTLKPGEFVLVRTVESLNLPSDLTAYLLPRSTLIRSGVHLLWTQAAPGYKGSLTAGMKNLGESSLKLEMGARFAHIQFYRVEGATTPYRGQWQGGRVSTGGTEKQV